MSKDASESLASSIARKMLTFAPPQGLDFDCNAFSIPFKILALALIACTLFWTWKFYATATPAPSLPTSALIVISLCIMLYTGAHMLISKTLLKSTGLQQSWIWNKRVRWDEIACVKTIRVPHLEWLIAPRLYVKTLSGRVLFFYAAEPAMWAAFEHLESEINTRRKEH